MMQFRCSNCFGKIQPHVVEQLQDGTKCFCNNCGKPLDRYTKYNPQTRDHEEVVVERAGGSGSGGSSRRAGGSGSGSGGSSRRR